jgi:uncharacterized membrane protein YdbT with pleckstrin-like domain
MNQAKPCYSDRPSWSNQMGSFAAMMILILMPYFFDMPPIQVALNMLAALLVMMVIIYNRYKWKFRVNDDNVQSRHGIIALIKQQSISLKDIRGIQVKQTTIQRLFDVGDVEFHTAGNSDTKIVFVGIKFPFALKDKVLLKKNKKSARN